MIPFLLGFTLSLQPLTTCAVADFTSGFMIVARAVNHRTCRHLSFLFNPRLISRSGAPLRPESGGTSLHLEELHQVLQDEELARRLQEEEEEASLSRRVRGRQLRQAGVKTREPRVNGSVLQNSQPPSCAPYPEGDFRAAQVAQDEVRRGRNAQVNVQTDDPSF